MTLAWPDELPRPLRDSWNRSPQDARQKRPTEAGPPGFRRRFSSAAKLVSMAVELDKNQQMIFWRFYEEDTAMGSLPFTMADPTTDGWPMLDGAGNPMLTDEGMPILLSAQWLCLFGEQVPTESLKGVRFRIAFSVAVMP